VSGDGNSTILPQITCMRERSEQLWRNAAERYAVNSAISIRLRMIYTELVALEDDVRAGNLIDEQAQKTVLSKTQIHEIAALVAERLGKVITVYHGDDPLQQSKRPS